MRIKNEYPPNIDLIRAHFNLTGTELFCYGDTIYAPKGKISVHLIAHEKVHMRQQGDDPDAWWERYCTDKDFRFQQELEAHRAEYQSFCENQRSRERRVQFLHRIAFRLSGPLYGANITVNQAMRRIARERDS